MHISRGNNAGFTLVEIMIAAGLVGIIALGSAAVVEGMRRGVKGAEDSASVTSNMTMLSQLLSNSDLCHRAIRATGPSQNPIIRDYNLRVGNRVRDRSRVSYAEYAYVDLSVPPGTRQEILRGNDIDGRNMRGLNAIGAIGIPDGNLVDPLTSTTHTNTLASVLLNSRDADNGGPETSTIPGEKNMRVARMTMTRISSNEELIATRIGGTCNAVLRVDIDFEKMNPELSLGASNSSRALILYARLRCKPGENDVQDHVSPILSCGAVAPTTEETCREFGGTWVLGNAPPCLFERMRISDIYDFNVDPQLAKEFPTPESNAISRGITSILPGTIRIYGNDTTSLAIDSSNDNNKAPQISLMRSKGRIGDMTRGDLRARINGIDSNTNRADTLGGISFRGMGTGYTIENQSPADEYLLGAAVNGNADGAWGPNSSPVRLDFLTTRHGRDTWQLRGEPLLPGDTANHPELQELLRYIPSTSTSSAEFTPIPTLSIRSNQTVDTIAGIRFGVGRVLGDGTSNSEHSVTRISGINGESHTDTSFPRNSAGYYMTDHRGASIDIASTLIDNHVYSQIQLSSETKLVNSVRLQNKETGNRMSLEALGIDLRPSNATSSSIVIRTNAGVPILALDSRSLIQNEFGNPITVRARRSILASKDDAGTATWALPIQIKMAGEVTLEPANNAFASLKLKLYDCDVSTRQNVLNSSSATCRNLRKTKTGSGPLSNPERNALGMRDGQNYPDGDNAVSWDQCALSETQLEHPSTPAGQAVISRKGGCKLDLENDGWTVRAESEGGVKVRCEVQCYSLLMLN